MVIRGCRINVLRPNVAARGERGREEGKEVAARELLGGCSVVSVSSIVRRRKKKRDKKDKRKNVVPRKTDNWSFCGNPTTGNLEGLGDSQPLLYARTAEYSDQPIAPLWTQYEGLEAGAREADSAIQYSRTLL